MSAASSNSVVVGRLAPSPTGALHLGHARTFLFAFWSVRARGGRLVLRIEDLDVDRARPEFASQAQRDLEWLGLEWDQMRVQSSGLERIRAVASALLESGQAYACSCTRGDVRNALSAPHGKELRYPGTCRGRYQSLEDAARQSGRAAGVRFRTRDQELEYRDGVHGPFRENPWRDSGDFLIQRRDRLPAYHLAVVVDDVFDGVTEVVRGDDLLSSTPRHLALYEALAAPPPSYFHVPLVTDEHGTRLAKRAPGLGLADLRAAGADPRRIVQWVAESAGISAGERVTAAEVTASFRFERLPLTPVSVDAARLAQLSK